MNINRRRFLAAAAVVTLSSAAIFGVAEPSTRVIRVVAKRFDFTPNVITLQKGIPVVLEFTTLDVVMGFNSPDLGVRTDIIPGKVSQVRVVPEKEGTFAFFCDIFCGSGHEDMSGSIVVTA